MRHAFGAKTPGRDQSFHAFFCSYRRDVCSVSLVSHKIIAHHAYCIVQRVVWLPQLVDTWILICRIILCVRIRVDQLARFEQTLNIRIRVDQLARFVQTLSKIFCVLVDPRCKQISSVSLTCDVIHSLQHATFYSSLCRSIIYVVPIITKTASFSPVARLLLIIIALAGAANVWSRKLPEPRRTI